MIPYYMREKQEPRKNKLEIGAAVAGIVILVVCASSDVPRLNLTTPAARAAREREQDRRSLAEMQTRDDARQAELAKITRLIESTRSNLASLTEGYNTLSAQAATTTAKLQQFEATVQQTSERMTKFSESDVLQKISRERDDAITQSKQSDNQVRQLTLKLQKAGIYP